ncbi:hypothetical protein Kisp01_16750 [Kineosporia sp. NBRC 101677]|uniref:integrin alpha n=1 Tax=Kineosporia sp. NBRC 101677 TaxID=3032197 RepID=UPI0024A20D55|nr:integrin alpha [Kineosporia sp. NBRC 101677]GLY14660.1 hypothetical protein Kisp01_16750 [Kineosporia sp. NBRC 101677]
MKTSGAIRGLAALAGVLLVASAPSPAFAAADAPVGAAASPGRYSFDLTVVGVPTRTVSGAKQAGVVDVHFPDGRTQRLSQRSLGLGTSSHQRFGAAVSVRDLNGDGLSDLVVGAPGAAGKSRTGAAYLLLQSAGGFTAANASALDNNAEPGDRFGSAVAVGTRASGTGMLDLWVGAPGRDVNGKKDAGAVYRYYLNATTGSASFNDVISQDTAELSQSAETGDQFGEVLADSLNGVVVGVPHEDVGAGRDAGEVVFVRTNTTTDLLTAATTFTQNTKGIPGAAASGDRFGAALAPFGFAVGAPGDDLGTVTDAGRVQVFQVNAGSTPRPFFSFTQDTSTILGKAKKGNQYGAALALGSFRCPGAFQLAVGAPGTDVGKAKDAGAVFVQSLPGTGADNCKSTQLNQGKGGGLGGTAKKNDHLGRVITTLPGDPAEPNAKIDNLIVGVPGKDIGKAAGTGVSVVWTGKKVLKTFGFSGGNAKNQAYGSSFGVSDVLPEMVM